MNKKSNMFLTTTRLECSHVDLHDCMLFATPDKCPALAKAAGAATSRLVA